MYDKQIIEYAKDLYFKIDGEGNHKFFLEDIVNAVKKRYPDKTDKLNVTTVYRWSVKEVDGKTWETMFEDGQRAGLKDAVIEAAEYVKTDDVPEEIVQTMVEQPITQKLPEEQIREQAGKILALRATTAINIYNIVNTYIITIDKAIERKKAERAKKKEEIQPKDIAGLINERKTTTIMRMQRNAEATLNNLNIEVVEKERMKHESDYKKELEGRIDLYRQVAEDKLRRSENTVNGG